MSHECTTLKFLIENCKEIGLHSGCYEQRMLNLHVCTVHQ